MVIIPSRDVNMSQVEHDITARSTLNPQLAQADFLFPFFLGSPIFDETFMPLIVSLPLLCALGARIAFTFLNSDVISPTGVDASLEDSLLDLIVQGAFQGVLFQYVQSEHPIFAPALALLCIGRAGVLLFTSEGSEAPKIGVSAAAAIIGFAVAYLASSAFEEWTGVDEVVPAEGRKTRHSYRKKDRELARELAREARKQHMRARLREINARERSRSPSPVPAVSRPLSRSQARSTSPQRTVYTEHTGYTEHTERIPATLVTETSTTLTMEQMGYTGLGRLLDLELAGLRKRAATAEADRRRCKEERKCAIAQGDKARAEQLAWQVKRYAAMAESYTREADRRIIEATRANQTTQPLESLTNPYDEYTPNGHDYNATPLTKETFTPTNDFSMKDTAYPDYKLSKG